MEALELSVIVCAHNPPPELLRRTLDALARQTLPKDRWELLLVDNASKTSLASTWDVSWHPSGRHVFEGELGLSSARRRGMTASTAEVLVFVDDDNVLDDDYLEQAIRIGRTWPMLGAWGAGAIVPEFEIEPPEELRPLFHCLALREAKVAQWTNVRPCLSATPWGAGMCVRSAVAASYARHCDETEIRISDREGDRLVGGGDVEIAFVACELGLGMGVFPELRVTHLIPKRRLEKDYLLRLYEGGWLGHALLMYKWQGIRPLRMGPRGALSGLREVLVRKGLDREMFIARSRAYRAVRKIIASSTR